MDEPGVDPSRPARGELRAESSARVRGHEEGRGDQARDASDGQSRRATPGAQGGALSGAWATHAALLIVQVAFASQAVEAKIAMAPRPLGGEGMSPWAVAMARMLGATIFFQAVTRAARWLTPTTWREQLHLGVLSVLGIALNQTLFLLGLRLTSPMTAALLSVTIPVLSAGMVVLVGQERVSARLAVGIGIALSGVVWLTGVRSVDRGALVVLLNCFSYSAYIVFSRGIIQRRGAITVVTWVFTWGALLFAPLGMPALAHGVTDWSGRAWGYLAYIVTVPTIVAYLCNAWALGRSTATLVTVYIYLQPPITGLLAWVQLRQAPTARMGIAALLIVVGVSTVAMRRGARAALPAD